jgi:chromatin remodeling complex protein RSC6
MPKSVTAIRKKRVTPTKDIVMEDLDSIIYDVDIGKVCGEIDLKDIYKRLKLLRSKADRVMKSKTPRTNLSGFMIPVSISEELATFTGKDCSVKHSRIDMTRSVYEYIKMNNLQDFDDRRIIIADDPLKDLLEYDPADKTAPPLTYARIQIYLKKHYLPEKHKV